MILVPGNSVESVCITEVPEGGWELEAERMAWLLGGMAQHLRILQQRGVVLGVHAAEFLGPVLLEQPPHLVCIPPPRSEDALPQAGVQV